MNAALANVIDFPGYGEKPFIERAEVELVQKYVTHLAAGYPGDRRAVAFTGEPGVGKTWLLRHLAEVGLGRDDKPVAVGNTLCRSADDVNSGVHSLYFNLQDWQGTPEAETKALMIAVDTQIAQWAKLIQPTTVLGGGDSTQLQDLSRWLEADVRSLFAGGTKTLALFVDHAHERPWKLQALLDRYVLGPLTALPQVFTVTAGRGEPYPWDAPALRLHTEPIEIEPFNLEQTRQQLETQVDRNFSEEEIRDIWNHSSGYPRTNYALGSLSRERWREAFDFELQHMLQAVPTKERRKQLRECLEALCVLEGFREELIWPMLDGYCRVRACADRPLDDAETLRKELLDCGFIQWNDKDRPAMWKIQGRLRTLLRGWIESDRDLLIRMHCTAYRQFTDWARRYRKTSAQWQAKAESHRHALDKVSANPTDCPE